MPIYNQQVKNKANQIRADMAQVINTINDIQRLREDFKVASVTTKVSEVKAVAAKYGFDLSAWKGEDEPIVEPEITP